MPLTLPSEQLLTTIERLPRGTAIEERNRALLWTLAETGLQVSEVAALRFDDWTLSGGQGRLAVRGKFERELPVSGRLYEAVQGLRAGAKGEWVFPGFNKFGALGGAISPRGVELLVRHFGPALGSTELTPRVFRHSAVVRWFREGCSREEIQRRLGSRRLTHSVPTSRSSSRFSRILQIHDLNHIHLRNSSEGMRSAARTGKSR